MTRKHRPYAVCVMSADLLARIRRAEWMQERKLATVKDESRTPYRLPYCESWRQITQIMGPS